MAWEWDFGDGGTSTQINPWHQYTQAGTYTVRLIAMNPPLLNDTLSIINYIKVMNPGNLYENSNSNINIYPNPFTNELNIENFSSFSGKIQLTDIVGKILFETYIKNEQQIKINNLNNLEKGHYVLKILDLEGRIIKNTILQK